jgi:hypothetical protein
MNNMESTSLKYLRENADYSKVRRKQQAGSTAKLSFSIDKKTAKQLKTRAKKDNVTVSSIVSKALVKFLISQGYSFK